MKIDYEFTWCDFLTPCPCGKDCMVGDYECTQCHNFKSHEIYKNIVVNGTETYNSYFDVGAGYVECLLKKNNRYDKEREE